MIKKSFQFIIDKIGIPVNILDFRKTYNSLKPEIYDKVIDFENALKRIGNDIDPSEFDEEKALKLFSEIKQLMVQYEDIFDKEKYILYMAYFLLKTDLKNEENIKSKNNKYGAIIRSNGNGINYLEDELPITKLVKAWNSYNKRSEYITYTLVNNKHPFTDKDSAKTEAERLMRRKDYSGTCIVIDNKGIAIAPWLNALGKEDEYNALLDENKRKFDIIKKEFSIEEITKYLIAKELVNISIFKELGYSLYLSELEQEREKVSNDENSNWCLGNLSMKMFKKMSSYIDPDKMLLVSLYNYYNKYDEDLQSFTDEEVKELKDRVIKMEKFYKGENISLEYTILSTNERREIVPVSNETISFEDLKSKIEELDKHFIDGQYRDEDEIKKIIDELIRGTRSIDNYSDEDIRDRLELSDFDLAVILNRYPYFIQRLIEGNILFDSSENTNDEDKNNIIKNRILNIMNNQISSNQQRLLQYDEIRYLLESSVINTNEVFNFYMNGNISFEDLQRLQQEPIENVNFEDVVNEEELVRLFLSMKQNNKNNKDNKDNQENLFYKYKDAYKLFKINGKTDNEKSIIADSIMEKSDDLWEIGMVTDLYHMGLIPVDTLLGPLTGKEQQKLVKDQKIKPIDLRRLLADDNYEDISNEFINNIMRDPNIKLLTKFMLIVDIYPGSNPEDIEERRRLIELANICEKRRGSIYGSGRDDGREEPLNARKTRNRGNRFKTDIVFRYMFLSYFDKEDVSVEVCEDGNAIIYLPNKGEYIIEKMFTIDSGYGQKTFIIDEEVFNNNRNKIIKSKKDGTPDAVRVAQANRVCDNNRNSLKVIHSIDIERWVMMICEHFEVCEFNQELGRLEIVDPELREIANNLINSREIIIDGVRANMPGDDNEEPNRNPNEAVYPDA